MLNIGKKVVHVDSPPQRWFVLEKFSRDYRTIWVIARRSFLFGVIPCWQYSNYVYSNGHPEISYLAKPKNYYSLVSAIETWHTIKAWEAKELEKKIRKKFPSRIVYPIFVLPQTTNTNP